MLNNALISFNTQSPRDKSRLLILSLVFLSGAAGFGTWLLVSAGMINPFEDEYLLPWILMALVSISGPAICLVLWRRFDPFNPLVYATWMHFLPAYVLGALYLASGKSNSFFLRLISDQQYYLPLTLLYVSAGFVGLALGFALSPAAGVGQVLARRLPAWDWRPRDLVLPGIILLGFGDLFTVLSYRVGAIGYQNNISTLGATLYAFASLAPIASFLLWFSIFRGERRTLRGHVVIGLLISQIAFSMLMAGSRGALLLALILIAQAYWLARRTIRLRQVIIFGVMLTIALPFGMAYGTTFRVIRGGERASGIDEYLGDGLSAMQKLGEQGLPNAVGVAVDAFLARLEITSSLAVVVANYEHLAPQEASYGLENDIWTYTWTAFIPRVLWQDKPIVSDARAFSALYFNYGDNSFAITPIGDLLRNFGPVGVPLGMAVLGFALRILYTGLVEGQPPSAWRAVTYYMILTSVNYEGFYGVILPGWIRIAFVLLLAGIVINLIAGRQDSHQDD